MKRRRIYVLVFAAAAILAGAGVRIDTGQGYSDPIVRPAAEKAEGAPSHRTLEVRLKNRQTARPQYYKWSVSVPPSGSVEVECHEWMQVRFFGVSMFGAPRNSFRRVISVDIAEQGVAEPYDYEIRWRTHNA